MIKDVAESSLTPCDPEVIASLMDEPVHAGHHSIVAHSADSALICDIVLVLNHLLNHRRGPH